jgi:phosphate transport system substrate-binding protein
MSFAVMGCTGGDRQSRTLIQNKGSDTMVNVAQAWAENYRRVRPEVGVAVSGGGSGTGIAALINGTVDIATRAATSIEEKKRSTRRTGDPASTVATTRSCSFRKTIRPGSIEQIA